MSSFQKLDVMYLNAEEFLKFSKEHEFPMINNIGIILGSKIPICKVLYKQTFRERGGQKRLLVNFDSYYEERQKILKYIVEDIVIKGLQIGTKKRTLSTNISKVLRFIEWADGEDYSYLGDIYKSKEIYTIYVLNLKNSIRLGEFTSNYANSLQLAVISFLRAVFNDSRGIISGGIDIIPKDYNTSGTSKSLDKDINYSFRFYFNLFNQISDFLLEKKSYPFEINLPNENLWILPYKLYYFVKPSFKKQKILSFDYKEGRIRTLNEIEEIATEKNFAKQYLRDFNKKLSLNNNDFNTDERLYLGSIALQAYFMHFLMLTGMNDSTAASLPMLKDYNIKKERVRFRTIKYRAKNKTVEFEIGHKFIKYFKKFLELRSFILNGKDFEYLFFIGHGNNVKFSEKQRKGGFSSFINDKMIANIDKKLPKINSRQSRVNKTYYNLNKFGIAAAAKMSQSSISTILKSYTGETEESSGKQFSEYFEKLNKNLIIDNIDGIDTSVGQCRNINLPKSEIELNSIKIDCKQKEGCLFCEQYACHVDEKDIRKLLSLKYVIYECKYVSYDEEHFNSIYKVVLDRIKSILEILSSHNLSAKKLILQIKEDVFENENLDSYWEYKLKSLIDMGILK